MVGFRKPNIKLLSIAIVMIAVGLLGVGFGIYQAHSAESEAGDKPNFSALIPKGKTIESLGGWQKLTAPNGDVFNVYVDNVSGVSVNVSQQQLPGKFKNDLTNQMTNMARAYNANTKLDANGTKVYVGTSAKGPQSVIFTKNGVLVLMKSWATIPDADWITYINSLE